MEPVPPGSGPAKRDDGAGKVTEAIIMQHLILHIGRHKTGTTALQYCFSCNEGPLAAAGIHYPRTGIDWVAHHRIAARLSGQTDPSFDPAEDDLLSELLDEIRKCGQQHVLISSEGFQSCDPAIVRRAFQDFDISVVAVSLKKLSYLQSSYLQSIHAEKFAGSIEEYERDEFFCDYSRFLSSWENSIPVERIITRVFSRDFLKSGDVVSDFFNYVLGEKLGLHVRYEPVKADPIASNASLKGRAIAFKKRLNTVLENDHYYFPALYKALSAWSSGVRERINLVSPELAGELERKYRKSNIKVMKKLSLPPGLLEFRESDTYQTIESMGPAEFLRFLRMIVGMDKDCEILLEDCYRVDIRDCGSEWLLKWGANIRMDSLRYVKIRQEEATKSLADIGSVRSAGHAIRKREFNPDQDRVFLEFDDRQTVNVRQFLEHRS
jgi:hypothetical protein